MPWVKPCGGGRGCATHRLWPGGDPSYSTGWWDDQLLGVRECLRCGVQRHEAVLIKRLEAAEHFPDPRQVMVLQPAEHVAQHLLGHRFQHRGTYTTPLSELHGLSHGDPLCLRNGFEMCDVHSIGSPKYLGVLFNKLPVGGHFCIAQQIFQIQASHV